jgi:hypothetical protein
MHDVASPRFTLAATSAALEEVLAAPRDGGRLEMIVRRPKVDAREVLSEGELDPRLGLVGDSWAARSSSRTRDRSAHPDMMIAIMGSRVIDRLATSREEWPLAGDQLFVDLDLSEENLPTGTCLAIGEVLLEVTAQPHTGCSKFVARFGADALTFVNARERRPLRLRGIYARVVRGGRLRAGDVVRKVAATATATAAVEVAAAAGTGT